MRILLTISDALQRICRAFAHAGSWLMIVLIAVIVYDVLTRKFVVVQQAVMRSWLYAYISPAKLQELEWHLHAVIFLLALALAYFVGEHVRVDLWREGRSERTRAWIELIAITLLGLPFCALLAVEAWQFTATSYAQGEHSPAASGLPHRWIVKSFVLAGTALLCAALVSTVLRLVVYLFGPRALRAEALARLKMVRLGPLMDSPAPPDEGGSGASDSGREGG